MIQTELYEGDVLLRNDPAPYLSVNDEVKFNEEVYHVVKVQFVYSSASDLWVQCVLLAKRPEGW